jgi:DNA-binding LacI/PurR family transcriptional regulator
MPTIKDVAREAKVSIATVSYVMNNKDANITAETRQQVLRAVERTGYTPNITARNLKANRTRLIGYAWHETPGGQVNSLLDRFTYCLAQAAESAGYHILTFTDRPHDPASVYNELIRTRRVDAFVLASTIVNDPRTRFLIDQKFPFVSFGRVAPDWDFNWVDTDGRLGVYDAVRYLIGLGHRRIAMIAWPEESLTGTFRLQGYLDGLADAGIAFRPDYLLRTEHNEQSGREAMAKLWQLEPSARPTAIVAISDLIAIGVMNEARARDIHLGSDLSVIGFDNTPLTQYLCPSLTTIEQPIVEITQMLTQIVEDVLRGPLETRQVLVPPRLIVRGSSGTPAHSA